MKNILAHTLLLIISSILCLSCSSENKKTLEKMKYIQTIGDQNPQKGLIMLDSLDVQMRKASCYVRSKFDLLKIRLNDKADIIPHSDLHIKNLMNTLGVSGSLAEKQEVYFYAGSVYRDLQDTPRALEYFFKSIEFAKSTDDCDSIMLRNTYSNLAYLQYRVQNFKSAILMAKQELHFCKSVHVDSVVAYLHLGTSYHALNKEKKATLYLDSAFNCIIHSHHIENYQEKLNNLLCTYAELEDTAKAKICHDLISSDPLKDFSAFSCIAFAQYYKSVHSNDSAIIYCKRVLDDGTDLYNMYDAAQMLFSIYNDMGDIKQACIYANKYVNISNTLDLGLRQEAAASVNNEYQYHLDKNKEQQLIEDKNQYKLFLIIALTMTFIIIALSYIIYIKKRNRHLLHLIELSTQLQNAIHDESILHAALEEKGLELRHSKEMMRTSSVELNKLKHELQHTQEELAAYENALRLKETQLTEKINQNKIFLKLLHQTELEENDKDTIEHIRMVVKGKAHMDLLTWKQLYQTVDSLFPIFREHLLNGHATLSEQQLQVCYLLKIGLSKSEIQKITELSRATIWRWTKKFEWIESTHEKR